MKRVRLLSIIFVCVLCATTVTHAQVAINNSGAAPHGSAMLDVSSASLGLLVPRMTTANRLTLAATASAGLIVFDTDLNQFFLFNGSSWESASVGNLWTRSGSYTYATNTGDFIGIGTNLPSRKMEISGGAYPLRLTSSGSGNLIELDGTNTPDWAIGSWSTSFRIISSPDNFGSLEDQYMFSTTEFRPWANNTKSLGSSVARWSEVFGMNGSFSSNVTIDGTLGIGIASPAATTHIDGTGSKLLVGASGGVLSKLTVNAETGTEIARFRTNGSTQAIIDENGLVGIGTAVPSQRLDVVGNTELNGNLAVTGTAGIGIDPPNRTFEVRGPWQTARLSSTSAGSTLEFVSTTSNDWGITTWNGNLYLIHSTDDFGSKTDQYFISTNIFRPVSGNTVSLGGTSNRWSNVFSVDGNYTGNLEIDGFINGSGSTVGGLNVHDPNNALAKMYITPATTGSEDSSMLVFGEDHDGTFGMYWLYDGVGNDLELYGKSGITSYGPHMLIDRNTGNMAIGGADLATGYKVSIHGDVICEELRVELVANWPDYVFSEDYDLMTLPELESFIKKHGHLPDVPSAEQVEDQGFEVGEMQKVMLKKIEELSLYILEQDRRIEGHEKIIREQQAMIEELMDNHIKAK